MKKIFGIIIVLVLSVMCVLIFSACSRDTDEPESMVYITTGIQAEDKALQTTAPFVPSTEVEESSSIW